MEKKTKLITQIILGSVITLMTGYLIYEGCASKETSLIHKMTHIKLDEPINSGQVKDLQIINYPTKVSTLDTEYTFDLLFTPNDAGNREVEVTSSNTDLVEAYPGMIKVKNFDRNTVNYSKPVTITVTSKENPSATDSFDLSIERIPCNYLIFTEYNLPVRKVIETNYYEYEIETNKLFGLDIKGFESDNINSKQSTDKVKIEHSSNITRVSDYQFYVNKNDGKNCYIKATSNHQQISFSFKVTDGESIIPPDSYKIYLNGSEVNELFVNKEYEVRPFKGENYDKDLPFFITSNSSNIKITSGNKFKVLDDGNFTINFNVPGLAVTSNNYDAMHTFEGFDVYFKYQKDKIIDNKIVAYENHSFTYFIDHKNSTFKDINLEIADENIATLKDGYIYCKAPGETTLKITPNDAKYEEDYTQTYTIKVKPLITQINFNENIIFGLLYLVYGILIGVFVFIFIMNLKYLKYMPIAYLASAILLTIITLVQLASPLRYPTFALFSLFLGMMFIGVSLIYIGIAVYHSYNGYDLKEK